MRVVIGGTFAYLHKGHLALLKKAFVLGDYVYIGLTTDEYTERNKGKIWEDYKRRERELRRVAKGFKKKFEIAPLNDRFGPATTADFDTIVVSEETHPTALEINSVRKKKGLKELRIVVIGTVLAQDKRPITSTRISNGEIDKKGRLLKG